MKKNRIALLLAAALMLGTIGSPAIQVRAEGNTDTTEVEIQAVEGADGELSEADSAVIPDEDKEEIPEESVVTTEQEEEAGDKEESEGTDSALPAGEEEDILGEPSAQTPEITWNVTADGRIEIRYQDQDSHPDLRFAVWSREGGQDDISWNTAKSTDGKLFTAVYDLAKLKHYGTVFIHAYTGASTYVMGTSIETGSPSVGSVTVEDLDTEAGSCSLVLSELTHPELIKNITVPVWSDSKQADIVWYSAEKQTGKTLEELVYRVPMKIANHKNNVGTYNVHVYMTDTTGKQAYQTNTKVTFGLSGSVEVNSTETSGLYTASVKDLQVPGGWTELRYAVWSAEKAQDDLKWISTKTRSANINVYDFKHLGLFYVHLYAVTKSGSMKYVGAASFTPEVEEPVIELGQYSNDGTVSVIARNATMAGGMKEISVAVWSKKNGQDDLKWYSGSKQNDGSYAAQVNLKNHKDTGAYFVHVYGVGNDGRMQYLGKTDDLQVEEPEKAEVTVTSVKPEEGVFTVKVVLPENSLAVTRIQVPVWCASDQSDIKWYDAVKKSDGSYQVTVKTSNHKEHAGLYKIHVYGTFVNGIVSFLGNTSQEITPSTVSVLKDAGNGKRTVVIRNCANAKSVTVPVWSNDNGQDDLVWYTASKNSSGAWQVTIDSANHKNSGKYHVHVYADGAFAGNTFFTLDYSEVKTEYTELAASMETAASSQQLILVAASGSNAQITMLNKNSDGTWFQLLTSAGYVGQNGVGPTTEWNRRTPQGVYGFTKAFGIRANPGTAFDYVQVDNSHYWVDDVNSKYYNQFVSTRTVVPDWSSAEHLIDYTVSYGYCLALDYNPECTPGAGSAIFLHCSSGRPTLGCISVPENVMKKIMQTVRTDCKIVIDSKSGLASY